MGKSIAEDLWQLGLRSVPELRGRSPEKLYARLCSQRGVLIDRCMLYVLRCAVYFASTKKPKPELLRWWNWKDRSS